MLVLVFLLVLLLSSGAPAIESSASESLADLRPEKFQFKEAPQFYNSPDCPPPLPPSYASPDSVCSGSALVHVAMTLDLSYLRGSTAAIHSILHHASCPQSIQFHFLASGIRSIPLLNRTISSSFPSLPFLIHPFNPSLVSGRISTSIRSALDKPLNYARSYLPLLLPPCVSRIVYLDSDLILMDDIALLFSTPIPPPSALAAPEYCTANFSHYFTPAFWAAPTLSQTFSGRQPCYFNTGVMVLDLDRWRQERYTQQIERWMDLQKRFRIYDLGSLPPFLLVFAGRIAAVDHRWNQHGLGGDNFRGLCRDLHPGPVSLLHWSGKGKPWARIDAGRPCSVDALWAPYDLLQPPFSIDE